MTFCWRSTDSRYWPWPGAAAMRCDVCIALFSMASIWVPRVAMWLFIEVTIAPRMASSELSMSTTMGLDSLLLATRLLRWSWRALYSEICLSMPELSMPELVGSS